MVDYRFHPPGGWPTGSKKQSCTLATLLSRNVPRTVRVHPTKQGNGKPTKGGLSIPPWHNAICSTYFRPVAFFRFYPRLFSTPRPHAALSSVRFNPSFPPLSLSLYLFSPSLSIVPTIVAQASWPTRIFDEWRPLRSLWPTYVFGCSSALYPKRNVDDRRW